MVASHIEASLVGPEVGYRLAVHDALPRLSGKLDLITGSRIFQRDVHEGIRRVIVLETLDVPVLRSVIRRQGIQ